MASLALFSRGLLAFFVGSVTLWYLITPYLVRPHPTFTKDILELVSQEKDYGNSSVSLVENWTKWRLYIGEGQEKQTVYAQHSQPLQEQSGNSDAVFEWRKEYLTSIRRKSGQVSVAQSLPWYSKYGLYNHFTVKTNDNNIKFLPRFMFGLPITVVEDMYGGADKIPITGMLTSSTSMDRVIIQCYMNIVTLAVIFLLWAHNPPQREKNQ
jgi:hypothetical protein